jgi:hypothetical protein
VKEEDLHAFDRVVLNLNPFYINRHLPDDVDISDPVSFYRFEDVKLTMRTNGLFVYKHGSSTDLSVGRRVDITKRAPQGWYGDLQEDMDADEWMGVVEWIGLPFSAPGDSGSLEGHLQKFFGDVLDTVFASQSTTQQNINLRFRDFKYIPSTYSGTPDVILKGSNHALKIVREASNRNAGRAGMTFDGSSYVNAQNMRKRKDGHIELEESKPGIIVPTEETLERSRRPCRND